LSNTFVTQTFSDRVFLSYSINRTTADSWNKCYSLEYTGSPEEDDPVESGWTTSQIGADTVVNTWFTLRRAGTNGKTSSELWLAPTGDKPMGYQDQDSINHKQIRLKYIILFCFWSKLVFCFVFQYLISMKFKKGLINLFLIYF